MVYWLASASRPIHHHISSLSNRPRRPGPYHPTRMPVTSRVHHHHLPSPHGWAAACCACPRPHARPPASARPPARPPAHPPARARPSSPRLGFWAGLLRPGRAAAPGPARAPAAPRPQPDQPPAVAAFRSKRLRCRGGRSGSAISGHFRLVLLARARVSPAPNNPYFWAQNYVFCILYVCCMYFICILGPEIFVFVCFCILGPENYLEHHGKRRFSRCLCRAAQQGATSQSGSSASVYV